MQDPRIELWDEFLNRWPVTAIEKMTLDEYGDQSTTDCFTYWVERKLSSLGSIRGSTSFKFGVYKCAKKGPKNPRPGYSFDDQYGWQDRLGNNPQEVFVKVKAAILETIANVQSENLEAIDSNDTLSLLFKWKIAFLYQNREKPICPAIYSEDYLRFSTKLDNKATHLQLVRALMANYDGTETIFEFCEKVWSKYDEQFVHWFPKDYDPGFTVDDWINMLDDREVFRDPEDLRVMKRMKDFGGVATCQQLAQTYGGNFNHYNAVSAALAKRIHKKTNCPVLQDDENENSRWWPILYLGRHADKDTPGTYVWKLRPELSEAIDLVDLSHIPLYDETEPNYWILVATPKLWGTKEFPLSASDFNIGDIQDYDWKAAKKYRPHLKNDVKVGDKVICYETSPSSKVVGCFEVSDRDVKAEKTSFKKTADVFRSISWEELHQVRAFNLQNAITSITKAEYEQILKLSDSALFEPYSMDRLYDELWMTREDVDSLLRLIKHKKNVILQGAPGVGKTYTAKRLAYAMMGEKDESRIKTIQFHQSYSYEDFIMGYKPSEEGFKLRAGVFYEFCQQAAQQPNKDFFFIIDEINRGNLSKILGELMMLIERDHRGETLTLAYDGKEFAVPKNVYLIGMMNTADRSLALIDYALRRRFSFFEITPGFDTEGFKKHQDAIDNKQYNALIKTVKALNEVIIKDDSLGSGFQIAHSYFCKPKDVEDVDSWLKEVVHYDLLPTLSEYWFDDHDRFNDWKRKLTDAVND